MKSAGAETERIAARYRGAARVSALLAIFAACVLPGQGRAAPAAGELRVILGGVSPPFEYYRPDGTLAGFDVDISEALCVVLALRCAFIEMPWAETIPALIAGRGDAIISSMSITEERKKLVAFTNRYYRTPMQFAARKGLDRPITRDGLKGLKLGATAGTTAEKYARRAFGDAVEIVSIGTENVVDLYHALVDGTVDVILTDSLAMWPFIASPEGRDIAFVGDPVHVDEDIGIAVRKEDAALREKLNAAIARIRLDGTYQKINARYFPFSIY